MTGLRDHLTKVYKRHGELTPAIVVDEARPDESPLHSHFEWDDAIAAEAHRRTQAAALIRSCRVVYAETPEGEAKSARAFLAVSREDEPERRTYRPVDEVLQDDFSRRLVLRECEREVAALQRKYGHLKEFAAVLSSAIEAAS